MWEHLAGPKESVPQLTVVLLGSEVSGQLSFLGRIDPTKEVVTYHHQAVVSEAGETQVCIDAFLLSRPRPDVVSQLSWRGPGLVVASFDWRGPDQWPRHLAMLEHIAQHRPGTKFVLTSHNLDRLAEEADDTAPLSREVDACHQFLRTAALKLAASALIYPLQSQPAPIWRAVVLRAAGVTDPAAPPLPPANFVGQPVVVYSPELDPSSPDSPQKILTINPEFDYAAAHANALELRPLARSATPLAPPVASLPLLLERVIAEYGAKSGSSPPPASKLNRVVGANDEHRMLSDFFNALAEKST